MGASSEVRNQRRVAELVAEWQRFADETSVVWRGHRRSWRRHTAEAGFDDEMQLVQPSVFPAFARRFLGWEVGESLSPEQTGAEGRPDFSPADPVTHPFVFETKGSSRGVALSDPGDLTQVTQYLQHGRPRITKVVVTNLVGLRVFTLDERGLPTEQYEIRLRDLLTLGEHTPSAGNLPRFIDEFERKELTREEKVARIRAAPDWNPLFEVTSSDWVIKRLDHVVSRLHGDVMDDIASMLDPTVLAGDEREAVLVELHLLGSRLAEDLGALELDRFVHAVPGSAAHVALQQYAMHVAYHVATRLLLVRIWEDLGLLEPMLHDGGFDEQMTRFGERIEDVADHAFGRARDIYRPLFKHSDNYSWFVPTTDVYVDVIYELAFTYLGQVDSDVLGQVYERLLHRIDRKLLGQYYTPRDVIRLIWDLVDVDAIAETAEAEGRAPRVFDIAAGSGGFLVEGAARLRERLRAQREAGAAITTQQWINSVAEGFNGVEIQYFSRYLAEVNLLVQIGQVVAEDHDLRIAPIGVIAADTLTLYEPDGQQPLAPLAADQPDRAAKLKDVVASDFEMDVACGNPPYIGERLAAPLLSQLRRQHPYWEQFVAPHLDYLYWFLVVGVSKLRAGGRFGFITTEYWLRAAGARPLRAFLARHCAIERVVLFRDLRLFPDAPGQHSMVVVGTRVTAPRGDVDAKADVRPLVSIYEGDNVARSQDRVAVMEAIRNGASRTTAGGVRTFASQASPNALGGEPWSDIVLTQGQLRRRSRLRREAQLALRVSKGVETTLNGLQARTAVLLPEATQRAVGWPDRKPGIQLLRATEVAALGALTARERKTLRPVVNTRDVFPYAAVLPPEPDVVVYLPKPAWTADGESDEQVVQGTPMPSDIPALVHHLEQYRAVLASATSRRGERRPWWSLHRARHNVIGDGSDERWEPYCLTARWGGGARLLVGLAPGGSSPASGLHLLRPAQAEVPVAYLVALYNSTIVQAIVDSLPPGNLRAEDLVRIGAPWFEQHAELLASHALELADIVQAFVTSDAARFPLLPDALHESIALPMVPADTWTPAPGPVTSWGPLDEVRWVRSVTLAGSPREPLGDVEATETLLGRVVEVTRRARTSGVGLRVEVDPDVSVETIPALVALLRGAASRRTSFDEARRLLVPVDVDVLVATYTQQVADVEQEAERYRRLRGEIDAALDDALS